MKYLFICLFTCLTLDMLSAQDQNPPTSIQNESSNYLPKPEYEGFFKFIPRISEYTPLWAKKMYAFQPNVYEVDALYHKYYDEHPFEKTIHTQNYKHWRRLIKNYVQANGLIKVPSREEENELNRFLKKQRYQNKNRSVNTWTSLGPVETYKEGTTTPVSLHANAYCIDQSKSNANVLYTGTEGGGVFKTIDKGLNWTLVSKDEVFAGGMSAIQIHPTDENIVLVAGNNRIYKTTDGGSTWNEIFVTNSTGNEIKFHPINPDTIFCTTSNGLYRSNDGGTIWSTVFSEACWDIDFHPTNPDSIYLLKSNAALIRSEFFVSGNAGTTWTLKDLGWYTPDDPANANNAGGKIAVTAAAPDMIYVCLIGNSKANDNGWIGVYRSIDRGETWVNPVGQDGGPYNSANITPWNVAAYSSGYHQGFYNFDLEVSDINPAKIWIGTVRLTESSDSAKTFTGIGAANGQRLSDIHADIQDIEVIGNDIWVASDGGINYSSDELMSHESRKKNIIGSDFWGFGSGWNEDVLVGGKYHNGNSAYYQTYGTGNYHNVGGVEEATGYVHPYLNRKSYFNQYWSGGTVSKSIPDALGGTSESHPILPRIPNESYVESSSSGMYFDPRYGDHFYIGDDSHIYKSTDGGSSFTSLHDFGASGKVFEIEISRSNPDVLYAVFQPGGGYWDWVEIHKSSDGGNSWTKLTDVPTNSRWRMEFSINPENENEIWVSANNGNNGQKVYSSIDGGTSWQNKTTATLDGQSIKDIFFQAGTNQIVYVACSNGVFHFDQNSNDWVDCSTNLPFVVRPLEMRPFYRDNKLRLATYGRGIWEVTMSTPSDPIAQPITKTDKSYCVRDTLQFDCYSVLDHTNASWQWTFSPTPTYVSSTTARNPKVVLGTEGSYDVTLQITDGNGATKSKTINNMVSMENLCKPDTIPGLAMQLNANGDYAQTPDLGLTATTHFTMSAWIKPDGLQPNYSGIIMNDGSAAGLNFAHDNNTLAYHWPGGQWWWNSGLVVPQDEWSHVALVATPTSITLYLNGIPAVHNINLNPVDITAFKIGSYKGWNSRNVKGIIEEVCLWDRALSTAEIRALRHLTKEDVIINDPNFISYYQFNQSNGQILDKIGIAHATLTGGAILSLSTAPVGGGISVSKDVISGGPHSFGNTGLTIGFATSGTIPNGEVVVSKINIEPDEKPTSFNQLVDNAYWIVNNYGTNSTFSTLDSITFGNLQTISYPDTGQTKLFNLYKRGSNEEGNASWANTAPVDFIRFNGTDGTLQFSTNQSINSFSQFTITDSRSALVNLKVYLEGPYDNMMMNDGLRTGNLIPSVEPYTAIGFTHSNGGGDETCETSVFDTSGNDAIIDWVVVALRSETDSSQIVYSKSALLQKDGDIVDLDGISALKFPRAISGKYFISIHHRNHLPVMTANTYNLSEIVSNIDLRTNETLIFGGNLAVNNLGNGQIGLISGDIDFNGQVQNTDSNDLILQLGISGYSLFDVDMNGQIQNSELQNLLRPNIGKGSQVPD